MGRWQVGHTTRTAAADRSTVVRSASPRTHNSTPDGSDSSAGLRTAAPAVSIAASTRPTIAARSPDSSTIADALTPSGWSPRMPATITIFRWSPLPTGAPDTGAPETGAPDTGAFARVSPVDVSMASAGAGSVAVGAVVSVGVSAGSGAAAVGSVSAGVAAAVVLRVRRVVVAMVNYLHREWCGIRIRETRGALSVSGSPGRLFAAPRPWTLCTAGLSTPVFKTLCSVLFRRSRRASVRRPATRIRAAWPLCRPLPGDRAVRHSWATGAGRDPPRGHRRLDDGIRARQCRTRIRSIVAESQGAVRWLESLHDSGSIGSIRIGAK